MSIVFKGLAAGLRLLARGIRAAGPSPAKEFAGGFAKEMNSREAALILNLPPGYDAQTVNARHKKMLLINHPDRGGSTFLAHKINQAKDLLVGKPGIGKGI